METHTSSYYERVFSHPEMMNALALYLAWLKRNKIEADFTTLEDIAESGAGDNVLYHAEIEQQQQYGSKINYCQDVVMPSKG